MLVASLDTKYRGAEGPGVLANSSPFLVSLPNSFSTKRALIMGLVFVPLFVTTLLVLFFAMSLNWSAAVVKKGSAAHSPISRHLKTNVFPHTETIGTVATTG